MLENPDESLALLCKLTPLLEPWQDGTLALPQESGIIVPQTKPAPIQQREWPNQLYWQ